jgi:hypothetical protein
MGVRFWLLVFAAWLAVTACSESHDTAPASGDAAGQGSGAAGQGGSPGGGQGSGCGACTGTNLFGTTVPGCCTSDSKCGFDLTAAGFPVCLEANAPGNLDSRCPDQTLAGILPLKGCCRPDKTCGALDTTLGFGCATLPGVTATSCVP